MTPPAKRAEARDPSTLKPGDKMRLSRTAYGPEDFPGHWEWTLMDTFGAKALLEFAHGPHFLVLELLGDGTLRDNRRNIVEVLHAAD